MAGLQRAAKGSLAAWLPTFEKPAWVLPDPGPAPHVGPRSTSAGQHACEARAAGGAEAAAAADASAVVTGRADCCASGRLRPLLGLKERTSFRRWYKVAFRGQRQQIGSRAPVPLCIARGMRGRQAALSWSMREHVVVGPSAAAQVLVRVVHRLPRGRQHRHPHRVGGPHVRGADIRSLSKARAGGRRRRGVRAADAREVPSFVTMESGATGAHPRACLLASFSC